MARFGSLGTQYFDDQGDPLVDGLVYFYEPSSNTLKNTFADFELTTANTNPVQLTAAGRQPNIWFSGAARAILTTQAGVQIEVRDPVGATTGQTTALSDWNTNNVYQTQDLVRGSDGKYYVSLTDSNEGNDPVSSPGSWTQVKFIRLYNDEESYGVGDIVQATTNALLYVSLAANNVGNPPEGDVINWTPAVASTSGGGGGTTTLEYKSLLIEVGVTHAWPAGFIGIVLVSGSGGGGGGGISGDGVSGAYGGDGAESGARIPIWVDQSIDPSVAITIGSGGAGAVGGPATGTPGDDTTFGDMITFSGGGGGAPSPVASSPATGAVGINLNDSVLVTGWSGTGITNDGGKGGQGRNSGSGGTGGLGMGIDFRTSSLDNAGLGGDMSNGDEGGGGGGSWGGGAFDTTPGTKGGGGIGGGGPGFPTSGPGANGFIFLEWWEEAVTP